MKCLLFQASGVRRSRRYSLAGAASLSERRTGCAGPRSRMTRIFAAATDLPDEFIPFPIPPPKEVDSDGEVTAYEDEEATNEIVHDLSAAPYEQTLNRSFAVGGLGLHTGKHVVVRVRPAYAGEGRYFVKVPEGTNSHLINEGGNRDQDEVDMARRVDPHLDEKQTMAFMQFVRAAEDGYSGTFEEYVLDSGLDVSVAGLQPVSFDNTQEEIVPKPTDGSALDASYRNYAGRTPFCILLGSQEDGQDDLQVAAPEVLLAVLEGLFVDDARIEYEGAPEMPILDGSGQVWVENIAACGLRPAHKPDTPDLLERKQAWRPNVPISVFDHDSFVTLYPAGFFRRITAGVEFQDVPVIGSQWISFEAQAADNPVRPFATEFAPARTWVSSPEYAYAMRDAGYLAAGTPDCVLVADQDNWRDTVDVRFPQDEPARHSVMDIMGDLALLAPPGGSGMPMGHVVAFNADHALMMDFVVRVAEAIGEGHADAFPFMMLPSEADYVRQLKLEMVDDAMEAAGYPVHEEDDVKAAAAGDPGSPPQMARRELEKIQQALDESMEELEGEMAEKDRRAAEEARAADEGGDAQ